MKVFSDALHDDGKLRHVYPDGLLPRRQFFSLQLVNLVKEVDDAWKTLPSVVVELAGREDGVSESKKMVRNSERGRRE